jgi:G3E family GTPase
MEDAQVRWLVYRQGAVRAKGFFRSNDGIRLVQAVGPRIEVGPSPVDPPEDRIGRIVVIKRK